MLNKVAEKKEVVGNKSTCDDKYSVLKAWRVLHGKDRKAMT